MISIEFIITSLVIILIPGTGVIYTVSTGVTQGRKPSVFAALGCTIGIAPHLVASIMGVTMVMHASALAFNILKYAGAAYLLYIAYTTWRDKKTFAIEGSPSTRAAISLVTKAFFINILSPKLTIFFLTFLPQFIHPETHKPFLHLLVLSSVFMAMTFIVFVAYGFLANTFRRAVIESARVQAWLRRSFAATFAAIGINLALSEK